MVTRAPAPEDGGPPDDDGEDDHDVGHRALEVKAGEGGKYEAEEEAIPEKVVTCGYAAVEAGEGGENQTEEEAIKGGYTWLRCGGDAVRVGLVRGSRAAEEEELDACLVRHVLKEAVHFPLVEACAHG